MKKEPVVYLIDFFQYKVGKGIFTEIKSLTDNQFAIIAKNQGNIYSLKDFAQYWNEGTLNYEYTFIRII